jgi:hypothetical protein
MENGAEFLHRPWTRGAFTYDKLIDGSLTLADVAECNEALDVVDENERRWHAHVARTRGRS